MSDLNYIDKLVSSKLAGHAIETTGNSWLAISRIAFWRNFLIFSFTRFNVYYAALILLLSVSSILYLVPENNNTQQTNIINTNYQPRKFANTQNNQLAINNSSIEISKQQIISTSQQITNTVKNNNLSNNNIENSTNIKSKKPLIISKNKNIDIKNEDISNKSIINNPKSRNHISTKSNINQNASNKQFTKDILILDEKISSNSNNNITPNYLTNTTDNLFDDNIYYGKKLSQLKMISTDNIGYNGNFSANTIQALPIDSVDYYLPVDERNNWMLEVYLSPLYTNNTSNTSNSELTSYLGKKQEIEKAVLSFTTGMNIIYQGRNNLIFQTGVSYSQLGEFISREDINEIIHSSHPLYPQGGFYNIDTIQFYNIDSLLQGIEYIETVYDSAWVNDNSIVNTSDTTLYKGANNRNKYSYFEIPVMVGYSLPYGQFNLQLKAGIITSIFINANGNKLNLTNEKEIVNLGFDSPQYRQVNYSFVSGFDLNYQLSSRFDLSTGIYYRRNLYTIFENYSYSQKHYAGEFHLGIKYHL